MTSAIPLNFFICIFDDTPGTQKLYIGVPDKLVLFLVNKLCPSYLCCGSLVALFSSMIIIADFR